MSEYIVVWEIGVEAKSHREAAELAKQIQLDPDSTATFFVVISAVDMGRGTRQIIDVDSIKEGD